MLAAPGSLTGLKHHGMIKCRTNKNQHFIRESGWEMKSRFNETYGAGGQRDNCALAESWGGHGSLVVESRTQGWGSVLCEGAALCCRQWDH